MRHVPLSLRLVHNDDPGMDESEYLSRSHYTYPTQTELPQQVGDIEARSDQANNTQLDFWDFDIQHDSYSYLNGQSGHHDDNPGLGIGGEAEVNTDVETHEQGPPLAPGHRHRRYRQRRHRRHWLLAESEPQPQPRLEQVLEREPQIVGDLNLGLSDEERRVLAEFDAAVRHARSSGGPSANLSWGTGHRYGFGGE